MNVSSFSKRIKFGFNKCSVELRSYVRHLKVTLGVWHLEARSCARHVEILVLGFLVRVADWMMAIMVRYSLTCTCKDCLLITESVM